MRKLLIILLFFPLAVKSQIVADTVYANAGGGVWIKYLTYRNTATTIFLPRATLADSLTSTNTLINGKLSLNGNGSLLTGLTKIQVGLSNVDNTTDAGKPVSTAQQTALNLKANLASPTFTGTVGGVTSSMVGLGNVDNTSDANKPVSSATQTALNLKANLASPTFTGTVAGITATMVGLGNVNNTSDASKPISTSTQTALDLKSPVASPTFTGTVSGITATMVGLGSVNNTSDAAKPVSTATQTALNLKANLASPTFTGTVAGITSAMVGLGNVDNTTDAAKPVSTATQTALNLKANLTSAIFVTPVLGVATGTSLAVTGAISSSGGGIGYATGAGGTVTQLTNKATAVILNKLSGAITMNGAALAAAAEVAFTFTNSFIASTDVVYVCVASVGTAGAYLVSVGAVANGSCSITVSNASAGSLSQAIVLNFVVIKGVNN